ncbi:MAG: hypothetical protein QOE92_209 [Chloroflexota bacterium]|jgi:TusA-related sulfurtransferase|nr:hypothetical protein [Chloroflexota bacterium]
MSAETAGDEAQPLDLRGTPCPLNYVKTRLRLERMALGDPLEVWLDLGEPAEQVPRSLRMDGHDVAEVGGEGYLRILVRRLV